MSVDERLFHEGRIKIPYRWPAGQIGSGFLRLLRDECQIVGTRCDACGVVYCPPRSLCLSCYRPIDQLVPVGPEGTVVARAGGLGLVLLDGATTALLHRVDAARGSRVAPEWAATRTGSILDLEGFHPTGTDGPVPAHYGVPFRPRGAAPRLAPEVAILGAACTPSGADRTAWSYAEMVHEVVAEVLAQTGLDYPDIDTMVTASSDFLDGRTISDMAVQDVVGAPGHSASKVSMDGLFALLYGVARINSGLFDTALVVAHAKSSEGDARAISRASFDPIFIRPLGVTDHDVLRLQADRYAPGQSVDLAPDADAAVAVLLAGTAAVARHQRRPVWLAGAGCAAQPHSPGDRDLGSLDALQHAARQAGVEPGAMSAASVMALSSVQAQMWEQALGVPSDRRVSPNAGFATGLEGLARVYRALAEHPGAGVAHAVSGYTGQNQVVWRLRA